MPVNDFLKHRIKFFPTISKFLGINRDAVVCLIKSAFRVDTCSIKEKGKININLENKT